MNRPLLALFIIGWTAAAARGQSTGALSARDHLRRGEELFRRGRIAESIESFDRAVVRDPRLEPHLWQRGIALYYAERFEDCRRQFESHQTVNPSDVENGVWHYLCNTRLVGWDRARDRLLPIKGDPRVPMAEIYRMFRGDGSPDEVRRAARSGSPSPAELQDRLFYADLYVGLYFESLGESETAAEHIARAARDDPGGNYMRNVARVHLAARGGAPATRVK